MNASALPEIAYQEGTTEARLLTREQVGITVRGRMLL
jgi:hypothetical protein